MILAAALSSNKNITSLDLSSNELQGEGVEPLVILLREKHNIRTLNLSDNRLRSGAITLIRQAIMDDKVLEDLDLSDNAIEDTLSGEIIGSLLFQNKVLRNLNLSRNCAFLGPPHTARHVMLIFSTGQILEQTQCAQLRLDCQRIILFRVWICPRIPS
jgi:Ran GTPase-activating protein (RanGAP) involved in mRNA processing and transport